jgi:hypothetical protein
VLSDSLTVIGYNAFGNCDALTSIEIPDSVITIEGYAFYNCPLLSEVTFGENSKLTTIDKRAFGECWKITKLDIPDGVTFIGNEAFGNTRIKSLTIPEGLTEILFIPVSGIYDAINGPLSSVSLTTLYLPSTLTKLDIYAMRNSRNLTSIYFNGTVQMWQNVEKGDNWDYNTGEYTVYCTDGQISKDGTVTYN